MSDIEAFSNRLAKNHRHWSRWARRQGIECYRVYDRDIPQFPLAITAGKDKNGHSHQTAMMRRAQLRARRART